MKIPIEPLIFEPVYKHRIWGGRRLFSEYGRSLPAGNIGESWELSDRKDGVSVVTIGPMKGATLRELVNLFPEQIVGKGFKGNRFPILVKILDARQRLSLQVHPDASCASQFNAEPKTEMWYILASEQGSVIYAGLRKGLNPDILEKHIQKGTILEVLGVIPACQDSALFIPAGMVHAIGEGCLILEIQQNSDTTYRLFDWGRLGADGKPRQLHFKQAFESIRWDLDIPSLIKPPSLSSVESNSSYEIVSCPYFRTGIANLSKPYVLEHNGKSFSSIFVVRGSIVIEGKKHLCLKRGDTCLIPACMPSCSILPQDGMATLAISTLS